jgi:hypothetical protein
LATYLGEQDDIFDVNWCKAQVGWKLSGGDEFTFWALKAIEVSGCCAFNYAALEAAEFTIHRVDSMFVTSMGGTDPLNPKTIYWGLDVIWDPTLGLPAPSWFTMTDYSIKALAHEVQHAVDIVSGADFHNPIQWGMSQANAIRTENLVAKWLIGLHPKWYSIPDVFDVEFYMRPGGYLTYLPAPHIP